MKVIQSNITPEGGMFVYMINKTGLASVKGAVVKNDSVLSNGCKYIVTDVPDPIGVMYDTGIPDGQLCRIVVGGIAQVLFTTAATTGQFARGLLSADSGTNTSGIALCENVPTSPFATDKHFYEIGHVIETTADAGLAKCIIHFN